MTACGRDLGGWAKPAEAKTDIASHAKTVQTSTTLQFTNFARTLPILCLSEKKALRQPQGASQTQQQAFSP